MVRWSARLARAVGSPLAAASLAAPLAGVALLATAGWIEWRAALDARATQAWAAATAVALLSGIAVAAAERRLASALARAAVALLAVQLAAAWAFRLDGTLDAGEGEQWPAWGRIAFGPAARPPDARLVELPSGPEGPARLEIDGRDVSVPVGREVRLDDGLWVRVRDVMDAPSFEVRRASGVPEGAGLLKVVPGERTWFEAGLLPHRFYVTLAADRAAGARLRLAVQRGKVRVVERDVALDDPVQVEGLSVSFGRGARWSRIEVRRRAPPWPALAALALGAAAGWVAWRDRRRRA